MNKMVSKEKEELILAKQRKQQFEDIMANAKPMLTDGIGVNSHWITALANVPIDGDLCYVDKRYQGNRLHKRIKNLENNFDKRKLTPIILVPHYDEHRFAIVDGQGRFIVCPKKGMTHLFAIILCDAPEDPVERLKFEAEHFIGQDTEVEKVKQLEKHPARVILGDPGAVAMENSCKKYKVKFSGSKGNRAESYLGSYNETYDIACVHGEDCLNFIFSIIKNAGWNRESNGYATYVIRALKSMYSEHPNERKIIHNLLSSELRETTPERFKQDSCLRYPKRADARMACTLYTEDLVCDKLHIGRKVLHEPGEKILAIR